MNKFLTLFAIESVGTDLLDEGVVKVGITCCKSAFSTAPANAAGATYNLHSCNLHLYHVAFSSAFEKINLLRHLTEAEAVWSLVMCKWSELVGLNHFMKCSYIEYFKENLMLQIDWYSLFMQVWIKQTEVVETARITQTWTDKSVLLSMIQE